LRSSRLYPKSLLTPDGVSQSIRNALKLHESLAQSRTRVKKYRFRLSEAQKLAKIGSWEQIDDTVFFF
jgi:hypothetical protein